MNEEVGVNAAEFMNDKNTIATTFRELAYPPHASLAAITIEKKWEGEARGRR